MSLFIWTSHRTFNFQKKKEKNKKTKAINLSQYRHSFYFIFFLCFFFHQKHLGNFYTITRERISDTDVHIYEYKKSSQCKRIRDLFHIINLSWSLDNLVLNKWVMEHWQPFLSFQLRNTKWNFIETTSEETSACHLLCTYLPACLCWL